MSFKSIRFTPSIRLMTIKKKCQREEEGRRRGEKKRERMKINETEEK